MNLRNIANGVTVSINPNTKAKLLVNDGFTVDKSGNQIPEFTELAIIVQLQSLATEDLKHLNLISQQGSFIYAYSDYFVYALRRSLKLGQDKLIFKAYGENEESEWIIKQIPESFNNWNKVLLWRQ